LKAGFCGRRCTNLVIDTSVFMSDTEINDLINKYHVIIPYVVLEELDNLKENRDSNKSYNARKQ